MRQTRRAVFLGSLARVQLFQTGTSFRPGLDLAKIENLKPT